LDWCAVNHINVPAGKVKHPGLTPALVDKDMACGVSGKKYTHKHREREIQIQFLVGV
jgi:hypothetical protein